MITAMDLTKLGKYAEAVRKFTERIPKLPEVRAVKVNPTSSIEVYQRMSRPTFAANPSVSSVVDQPRTLSIASNLSQATKGELRRLGHCSIQVKEAK